MKIQSYVVMKEMETSLTTLLKYLVLTKYYFFIGLFSLLVCSLYWFVLPVSQVIIIHIVFLMQQDNAQTTQNQINHINFNCHRYPHNVIAHRRVKTNKIKDVFSTQITQIHPTTQNTQHHSFTSSLAQSIIQQEQLSRFVEQDRLYTEQFQRKMKTLETNSKLFVKDKGLIRKQQLSQKYSNQKSYTSQTDWRKHKSKDRSKLTSLQKEKKKFPKELVVNRKGPLQQKHLINWLNFVISEYCLQDTTQNSVRGLQRFALDKNTLLSKGLTNQNIYRVYQTLFAHSFGLNGSVEQLCAHKRDVVKAIWKVYAFLLQYCSNGSFQTIMGQLQRDMISNQKRLIGEIQKRQAIINRNDEIMQQKLEKYQKQNKQLRNTVQNYEGKIQQLQTEFREIQIAYNMEVRLRLNYQHKINKIYSVHQRLNIIHHSLLRDFQETDAINKKMTVQNKKTVDKNIQLKADYKLAMDQIYDQINKLRENESTIQALKMNEEHWKEKLSREVAIKDNEKHELKQKDKKIGQLQNGMRGLNLMIEMMKNSANSQFEDYRRVSTQNAELKLINSSQLQKINELVNQINYLNKKESQINIELNYLVIKTEQLTEQLSKREDSINDLKIQLEKKEIELHARVVQLESLRKSDQSLRKNMKEMKTICEKFQQQANTQRKYATQINQQFTRTHQQKLQLELKMKYTLEQKFQMELDLNRRISEIITLKKKYQADNTQQIKKYEKLHNVWSGQDKNQLSMAEQLANVNQQLQKAKIRISFLSRQFSDLNFQKAQVQAMYKNNLILHQKEKRAEKDLMIDISTLREKLEDVTRQLTMQTRSHQYEVDNWLKEKDKLLATISQQKIQIQKKQAFVHPMLLEDALHSLQRQLQTHRRTRIRFENDLEMENQKYIKLKMEMQKKEAQFRQSLKDNEKKIEQTRTELQRERQYFKVKTEELRTLNYTLQTRINYQKKEIEKKQDTQTKDDSKLLEIMKQKNAQIQQLLGELQRIEDNYQKKNVQYEQEIKSIYQQNESTITNLKQQKKELKTQLGNIEKEYQTKLIQKQKKNQQAILALKKPKDADQPQNQIIRKGKSLTHASSQMKRSEFIAKLKIATILSKK